MDERAPVVVIYRGNQGAMGIARTLGRLAVPMYLVSQSGMSTPIWASRFWSEKTHWDFARPEAESLRYLLALGRRIESRHGIRPVLLTPTDWAAIFIESHADALEERFAFPRAPTPVVQKLANKWSMFTLARGVGIPTPDTIFPQSRDEVLAFLEDARFPIVMKAADSYRPYVPTAKVVSDASELLDKFDRDAALGEPNLILQEYVPGDAESVWMCNAFFDRDGECQAIFTGKKLRQLSSTGIASLAVCLPNEVVAQQTRSFMQGVGYRGCVGIGYRYDARDGQYKVLDVNARISGVFRLFRASNGMDVVRACYLDLTSQPVPPSRPSVGRKWALEDDALVARAAIREGSLTLRQWLTSLRGVEETQWFAHDDPLPLVVWLANTLRQIFSRRWAARAGEEPNPASQPHETAPREGSRADDGVASRQAARSTALSELPARRG
jgi:D-aspartate ligase